MLHAVSADPKTKRIPPSIVMLLLLFVAGIVAFLAFGGTRYLTLETAKQHAASLRTFTEAHYAEALALGFATYVVAASLSLFGLLALVPVLVHHLRGRRA